MKYYQISIARLAQAGKRLIKDGDWHAFGEERVFYRVHGRTMQRIVIEEGEDTSLLQLFDFIAPFPARIFREGFREELKFVIEDDHFLLCGAVVRSYIGWDLLARIVARYGVSVHHPGGNVLEFTFRIPEWGEQYLLDTLALAKAVSLVASQLSEDARLGIPHIESEIHGLVQTAQKVIREEITVRGKKRSTPQDPQTTLFPNS